MSQFSDNKRKILVLHGYRSNAYLASRAMAPIIKECDTDLEFYFLDAPTVLLPVDPTHEIGTPATVSPPPSSLSPASPACAEASLAPTYSSSQRGWFRIDHWDEGVDSMPGVEDSLQLIHEALRNNEFEAIFGFGQGAAIAELITAMLEKPRLYPSFCKHGLAPHPPMRFLVAVSGFLLRGPLAAPGYATTSDFDRYPSIMVNTPVLHVIGRTNVVVTREKSDLFIGFSKNKRVEEHLGGHFIPTGPHWRWFFAEFFRDPFGRIASPSPLPKQDEKSRANPHVGSGGYAVQTFSIGRRLPMRNFEEEEEEEEEGISSGTLTPGSSSGSSDGETFTRTPYAPIWTTSM